MSEATQVPGPPSQAGGGSSLKQARLAQGMTLEGLASMLKVTPAKLEALEEGRYQDLPDAAFARALAMTVCRVLKIDSAAVLATLPAARPSNLQTSDQREVPFDASRTKLRLNMDLSPSRSRWPSTVPLQWIAPLLVLAAAMGVYLWPDEVRWPDAWSVGRALPASEPSVSPPPPVEVVPAPVATPAPVPSESITSTVPALPADTFLPEVVTSPSAMPEPVAVAASESASAPLVMVATEPSWVEVRDASGKRLIGRRIEAGETVTLDGTPPLALRIGNAGGLQVSYLGHAVELAAFTRNNVAKLELK